MTTAIEIARRSHRSLHACVAAIVTLVVLAGTLLRAAPVAAAGERPLRVSSHTVWLCRPGAASDPCASARTATSVAANLARTAFSTTETSAAKRFDCFYVYPTVSTESSLNSDLEIQKEEVQIAQGQTAQFSSLCNVWAPMYRQATGAAVTDGEAYTSQVISTAYDSVLAAWKDYLAHDNHGRPIIFIGHSQGAAMLISLLRSQIDPSARMRRKLVSAIILGGNVQVAKGSDVGGSFRHIPTCASASETGCVIAYSTFPSEPGGGALVGRPGQGVSIMSGQTTRAGQQVACVNPATFSSGSGALVPMYPTVAHYVAGVSTPWTVFPQLYSAQCKTRGGAAWLQVARTAPSPRDRRPSITDGGANWGYHIDDLNLALGNLILDVAYAEASYR